MSSKYIMYVFQQAVSSCFSNLMWKTFWILSNYRRWKHFQQQSRNCLSIPKINTARITYWSSSSCSGAVLRKIAIINLPYVCVHVHLKDVWSPMISQTSGWRNRGLIYLMKLGNVITGGNLKARQLQFCWSFRERGATFIWLCSMTKETSG